MKYILLFILSFTSISLASENCTITQNEEVIEEKLEIKTDVPSHLKDAQICIFKKETGYNCVPAKKFKIVPRKQQFIVTKVKQENNTFCKANPKRKRISIGAGSGPSGTLDRFSTPTKVSVEENIAPIGALQYQYLFTDEISGGVQVQSNETLMLNIGLDF